MNSEALEFIFSFQLAVGTNTIQVALQSQLCFLWPELWVVLLKNQNLYANKVSECLVRGWLHSTQSKTCGTWNKWKLLNLHSSNAWKWDYCIFCNYGTKYYGGNFITDNNEHTYNNKKKKQTKKPPHQNPTASVPFTDPRLNTRIWQVKTLFYGWAHLQENIEGGEKLIQPCCVIFIVYFNIWKEQIWRHLCKMLTKTGSKIYPSPRLTTIII